MNSHVEDINNRMYDLLLQKAQLGGANLKPYFNALREKSKEEEFKDLNINDLRKLLKDRGWDYKTNTLGVNTRKEKIVYTAKEPNAPFDNNDKSLPLYKIRPSPECKTNFYRFLVDTVREFSKEEKPDYRAYLEQIMNEFDDYFLLPTSSLDAYGNKNDIEELENFKLPKVTKPKACKKPETTKKEATPKKEAAPRKTRAPRKAAPKRIGAKKVVPIEDEEVAKEVLKAAGYVF